MRIKNMCSKAVDTHLPVMQYAPNRYTSQEMFPKVVIFFLFIIDYVLN